MSTTNFDEKTRRQESDVTLALLEFDKERESVTTLEQLEGALTLALTNVRQTLQKRKHHLGEPLTGPSTDTDRLI